jgi:hypothetical protein
MGVVMVINDFFTSVQRAFIFSRVGKNKIKNPTKLPCVET